MNKACLLEINAKSILKTPYRSHHLKCQRPSNIIRIFFLIFQSGDACTVCLFCGGYQWQLCPICNGSKRSVHRNDFTAEFVALKCAKCDVNGLIDPLPPLLKSVQKEDERARAQRIVEPAVGLLAYASLYLSLRCYESIIALHDKAAMSHRVDSRRALTSVQACFSRIFQPVSLKRNNLGVFGDGTSFPGTRGIRNVRDRMLQHA